MMHITPELLSHCLDLATTDQLLNALRTRPIDFVFFGLDATGSPEAYFIRYAWAPELAPNHVVQAATMLLDRSVKCENIINKGKHIPYAPHESWGFMGSEPLRDAPEA